MFKNYCLVFMAVIVALMLVSNAQASRENPASCLLFPYYDTTGYTLSIHTITNVGTSTERVRLVFIDSESCLPYDNWITLTAGDTFTFGAHGLLPEQGIGFLYAYVVQDQYSTLEKDADVLIGQELVIGAWGTSIANFSINAVGFQALNLIPDSKLHLDGTEFTAAPKTIYFPRFMGQDAELFSRVIMINLTGGRWFESSAQVIIYNDNEVAFSDSWIFDCYKFASLQALTPITSKSYLLSTNHTTYEPWPLSNIFETDTMKITGVSATNQQGTVVIPNASVYIVLVEGSSLFGYNAADLPMQLEDPNIYNNAMLWSTNPDGT